MSRAEREYDLDFAEGVLVEAKPSWVEWLQLYIMWLLLFMLAVTTVVLFIHARNDRTYTFDGCFAGSAAAEDAVVVTYGEGPICEGEK